MLSGGLRHHMAMFVVSCVLKASTAVGSDLASILMGVGRFLGPLGGGFGGPRSILDGFGVVLDWILWCVRTRGVSMEGLGPDL